MECLRLLLINVDGHHGNAKMHMPIVYKSLKSKQVVALKSKSIGVGTRGAEGARAPPTFLASTHVYIIHLLQPRAALA